jgi:hypothetical protein
VNKRVLADVPFSDWWGVSSEVPCDGIYKHAEHLISIAVVLALQKGIAGSLCSNRSNRRDATSRSLTQVLYQTLKCMLCIMRSTNEFVISTGWLYLLCAGAATLATQASSSCSSQGESSNTDQQAEWD